MIYIFWTMHLFTLKTLIQDLRKNCDWSAESDAYSTLSVHARKSKRLGLFMDRTRHFNRNFSWNLKSIFQCSFCFPKGKHRSCSPLGEHNYFPTLISWKKVKFWVIAWDVMLLKMEKKPICKRKIFIFFILWV